jgi:hypothetical protein
MIKEDVFMEIPKGFPGYGNPTKICKINRALYGLKQAPKAYGIKELIHGFEVKT